MIPLEVALERLLHKPSVLERFINEGPASLDVTAEDAAALAAIDPDELVRTARRIGEGILDVQHRGCGGLRTLYARTIAAHGEEGIAGAFLESTAFDAYRELPYAGVGCCVEEAFFRFVEAAGIGAAEVREAEFLLAMMRALAVCPDPEFTLPAEVRRAPGGFFAIGARGEPMLYAAVGGRLIVGPITPFLAALLAGADGEAAAREHGVAAEVLVAARAELVGLGLLAR